MPGGQYRRIGATPAREPQNWRVDDITTQRWVGKRDSASQAAAEFVRVLARRPWFWGLVAAIEVAYALFLAVALDDRYGPLDRVLWGTVYALVPTACVVSWSWDSATWSTDGGFGSAFVKVLCSKPVSESAP
jgi:hypothetical protein